MIRHLAALFAVCLATCSPAPAAAAPKPTLPIAVTASTLQAAITAAKPGDTLKLSGSFDRVTIKGRSFSPPLSIDASLATIAGVTLQGVDGVAWNGGAIAGNGAGDLTSSTGYGMLVRGSRNVSIARARVSGWARGIVLDTTTDFVIDRNWVTGLRTDGIDVALAQRGRVTGNTCTDFAPAPADHPDCFQIWSRAGVGGTTADIVVTGNASTGAMQCFNGFNHPERTPSGDPGFDRITMTGNLCRSTMPAGVGVSDCRDCTVTGNDVASLPGAQYKTQLNFTRSTGSACGNLVADIPNAVVAASCSSTPPAP